jgi:YARHG domain
MRSILRPAFSASSRQRLRSFSRGWCLAQDTRKLPANRLPHRSRRLLQRRARLRVRSQLQLRDWRLPPSHLRSIKLRRTSARLSWPIAPVSCLRTPTIRYLTRAELQRLSANRLHIARNEIFARRGRYFKDDGLRAYFSQFPWYQPRAWDVPLGPVEQANVGLIQSIEAPGAAPRGIMGPVLAQTKAENGVAFTDLGRRNLTPEELQGLSVDQFVIIRNEIFARRGRYFKDDALRAYFSQFPWYQPYAWDVPLSAIEQANVKLVQSFEQASTSKQASRAWRVPPM